MTDDDRAVQKKHADTQAATRAVQQFFGVTRGQARQILKQSIAERQLALLGSAQQQPVFQAPHAPKIEVSETKMEPIKESKETVTPMVLPIPGANSSDDPTIELAVVINGQPAKQPVPSRGDYTILPGPVLPIPPE